MERNFEISLSEALLDPGVCHNLDRGDNQPLYPALVSHQPYETVREPMLLFRPPTRRKETSTDKKNIKKKNSVSSIFEHAGPKHKKWDGFFSNKKQDVAETKWNGSLRRSRSFDTLHRRLTGWDEVVIKEAEAKQKQQKPVTFVYRPPTKKKETKTVEGEVLNKETLPVKEGLEGEWSKEEEVPEAPDLEHDDDSANKETVPNPPVPKRDSQLFSEGFSVYEVPVSILSRKQEDDKLVPKQDMEQATSQIKNGEMDSSKKEKESEDTTSNGISISKGIEDNDKAPAPPKPTKPPLSQGSSSPQAPDKPARSRNRASQSKDRRKSFTELDILAPAPANNNQALIVGNISKDIGLLRIKVLGMRFSQKSRIQKTLGDMDSDGEEELPVAMEIAPTDGLFCTLSINGKQSKFESSLQSLRQREQSAVWDQTETEAVFYATGQQQIFITSRKLPLKDHETDQSAPLSQNPKAECFGVGIYPLAKQKPEKVSKEDGSIADWSEVKGTAQEVAVTLEPHGNVLLGMSYIVLEPNSKVTCNGIITVKSLNGMDCCREGGPCWICCTIDIDNENFGTTSSILGLDDFLNKGFTNDPIEFIATSSTACRIQVWGFGSDETEYWFGEAYIPLAAVLPYSKHLVHQEEEGKPLKLLGKCEKEIIMPLEPMGTISVVFNMVPASEPDDPITKDTIQMLEASGIFTPAAIAHFRQGVPSPVMENDTNQSDISTIPEESSLGSNPDNIPSLLSSISRKKRFIPSRLSIKNKPNSIYASGEYDRLTPSPTVPAPANPLLQSLTRSFKDKRQTLRLLGGMKLQVPLDYREKAFGQLPDNFDPYREIEVLKVEMKDIKAQLAETQFHKEKAEVKVKTLEREVQMWKEKYKGKKKGRNYN